MTTRRLRMIAGPNGSGKSTLLDVLRNEFSLPIGYWVNADEIERELERSGRLAFGNWGVRIDAATLRAFLTQHPLAKGRAAGRTFLTTRGNGID